MRTEKRSVKAEGWAVGDFQPICTRLGTEFDEMVKRTNSLSAQRPFTLGQTNPRNESTTLEIGDSMPSLPETCFP